MRQFLNKQYKAFLLFLLCLFCAAVFTFPVINSLTTRYIGDGGDNFEYSSYMSLVAKNIDGLHLPFSGSNFWRYPVGFDFSRGFDSYLTVTIGGLLTTVFGQPLSYNITIFFLLTLNGLLSFLFFRKLSGSKLLAGIGMLMYWFSFYTLARSASHPNLLFTGGIPLLGYGILSAVHKTKLGYRDGLLIFGPLILIALGSQEYFVLSLFAVILSATVAWFLLPEKRNQRQKLLKKEAILPGILIFLIIVLLYLPQLTAVINGTYNFINRTQFLSQLTPSFTDFVLPNSYLPLLITKVIHSTGSFSIEKVVFFGFIEWLLFILAFFLPLTKRIRTFFFILFLIPFLLSLGYGNDNSLDILPYHFLSGIFPFTFIPETGRFFVIFSFFGATMVIYALSKWQFHYKNYFLIMILILLFLERIPTQFYTTDSLQNNSYISAVQKQNSQAVLDIPIDPYYPQYSQLSFSYNKPVVNGYFHWSADGKKERSFIDSSLLSRYSCNPNDPILTNGLNFQQEKSLDEKMVKELRQYGITTIVIHKDYKFTFPECKNVRLRLTRFLPFLTQLIPTDTSHYKQLAATLRDGQPSFTYYLPKTGTLYIDGAYLKSQVNNMFITVNNDNPDFIYTWKSMDGGKILEPSEPIQLDLPARSSVTFYSPESSSSTLLAVWYRYVPNQPDIYPLVPQVQFVTEDDKSIVYKIN